MFDDFDLYETCEEFYNDDEFYIPDDILLEEYEDDYEITAEDLKDYQGWF